MVGTGTGLGFEVGNRAGLGFEVGLRAGLGFGFGFGIATGIGTANQTTIVMLGHPGPRQGKNLAGAARWWRWWFAKPGSAVMEGQTLLATLGRVDPLQELQPLLRLSCLRQGLQGLIPSALLSSPESIRLPGGYAAIPPLSRQDAHLHPPSSASHELVLQPRSVG